WLIQRDATPTAPDPLSLHDALPISLTFVPHVRNGHLRWHRTLKSAQFDVIDDPLDLALPESVPSLLLHTTRGEKVLLAQARTLRSEEHTSDLQSRFDLVCRLLLEKT